MREPDGMVLGRVYNIYHVNNRTGQITMVEEKIILVDYDSSDIKTVWHFQYTRKCDIKKNDCNGFGLVLEDLSDQYVIQYAKMERSRRL